MKTSLATVIGIVVAATLPTGTHESRAGESGGETLLRKDFNALEHWRVQELANVLNACTYGIGKAESGECYLRAESSNSASGIVHREEFSVYSYPELRWRWRADRVYRTGDARRKAGDDYPLRLYVLFPYTPETASFREKIVFEAARLVQGAYPPRTALNYIWVNRDHDEQFITNAYTEKVMMIVKRGPHDTGAWCEEAANIVDDYRKAFGRDPPEWARIAVMNDSDNTGESSVSFIDYMEVRR